MWMDPPKSKYAIIEKKCYICNDIENDIAKNPILKITCIQCEKYFLSHDKCSYKNARVMFMTHLENEECFNLSDTTKCIQIYTSSKIKNIHININI